jgi:hypothetical protein
MMHAAGDLSSLERNLYRKAYTDGVIDLFAGLSLLFIGAIWVWATDYAGLAGVLPAVMAPSLLPFRKRIVEPRGGYVKWSAARRRSERHKYWAMVAAGVLVLLLGAAVFAIAANSSEGSDVVGDLAPGLLAFILAVLVLGVGLMMESWRFLLYAAALVIGGGLAIMTEANPGWPMLGAGAVITITGAAMLVRFLRNNPVVDSSG